MVGCSLFILCPLAHALVARARPGVDNSDTCFWAQRDETESSGSEEAPSTPDEDTELMQSQ